MCSPVSVPPFPIFEPWLLFYPEDGGNRFFQNVGTFLPDYRAS
jgi:hypothetical protein